MKTGLAAICGSRWAMRQEVFDSMCSVLAQLHAEPTRAETQPDGIRWLAGGRVKRGASVAVMNLSGVIDKRRSWMMDFMGGTSTDQFGEMLDALVADPAVKGIVIDTDSPGGTAVGTAELSKKIYEARQLKPIVSISNAEMSSAAYYVASAASKVFATPSSSTGSVGVWSAASDYSKALEADGVKTHVWRSQGSPYKAEFLPFQAFTQEAIDHEQAEVDRIYGEFTSDVARNRGISVSTVRENFGKGRTLSSKEALAAGMVDAIATLDQVVSRIQTGRLSLSTMGENMIDLITEPDNWKDQLETDRLRSELRRKGYV